MYYIKRVTETTTSTSKTMNDIKETAKEIRSVLKAAFPTTKFSVKCHQFSQGEAVAISWTDGPQKNQVEPLVKGYGDGYSRFIRISRRQSAVNVPDDVCNWVESYTLSAPKLIKVQAETAPQPQELKTSADDQLTELVALQELLISKVKEVNQLKLKIAELQVAADLEKYSQRQPVVLGVIMPQPEAAIEPANEKALKVSEPLKTEEPKQQKLATTNIKFFDYNGFLEFLVDAVTYYEKSAPAVATYLDDLYVRLNDGENVLLDEINTATFLKQNSIWLHSNYAQNLIYKLIARHSLKFSNGTVLINDW